MIPQRFLSSGLRLLPWGKGGYCYTFVGVFSAFSDSIFSLSGMCYMSFVKD